MLKLQFDQSDLALAKEFATASKVSAFTDTSAITIDTVEQDDDGITIGPFVIQLVEDVRVYSSLRGEIRTPCVKFVVTTEVRTWSWHWGEDGDIVEVSREDSLRDALKACALTLYGWELDNLLDSIPASDELVVEEV